METQARPDGDSIAPSAAGRVVTTVATRSGRYRRSASRSADHARLPQLRSFIQAYGLGPAAVLKWLRRERFRTKSPTTSGWTFRSLPERLCTAVRLRIAEQLPFIGSSFDGGWSIDVLEHVTAPESALLRFGVFCAGSVSPLSGVVLPTWA